MQQLSETSLTMKTALESGGEGFDALGEKAAAARGEVQRAYHGHLSAHGVACAGVHAASHTCKLLEQLAGELDVRIVCFHQNNLTLETN